MNSDTYNTTATTQSWCCCCYYLYSIHYQIIELSVSLRCFCFSLTYTTAIVCGEISMLRKEQLKLKIKDYSNKLP